ncbi:leucine--tRNA ligase [Candidatus Nomurabacteria bacterium]|nr:leucine--tRNA ligase [Candidatus Nomurabacteria bacterium]
MSDKYQPEKIEAKWQKYWEENQTFAVNENSQKEKKYVLDMFPYPSGEGLHVGHPEGYTASDIMSRYYRLRGFEVLHPMGWDAFGLPAENYAIKTGTQPKVTTEKNIDNFRRQIKSLGFSYDWSREINTTDPKYYQWTQWIFVQLFKNDLAYESIVPINWCPSCKTGLANEEVVAGKCDRCSTPVEKKDLRQWMLKITKYADRLLKNIDGLDWPNKIKLLQKNWIGKSEGAEVIFKVKDSQEEIKVFTTRPDTLFGATYLAISPEHALLKNLQSKVSNWSEVEKYIKAAKNKSELERTDLAKEKTGVRLDGLSAINPVNQEALPIFVADYILASYGFGAIMAVPAHDQRDWDFAKKFDLPIRQVVAAQGDLSLAAIEADGKVINSGDFDNLETAEAQEKITTWLEKNNCGQKAINYKLRDWVFSRQRYWGEPIPIIHCQKCGPQAVPEIDLPVVLPEVEKYEPTGTGESPLVKIEDWVKTSCPKCGGAGKRETNTMPQWAGSSWYWLRYIDPENQEVFADSKKLKKYLPVDLYIGGAEHAVLHLLYARFWNMFLYDLKVVPFEEPFVKLVNQGMILGEGGVKMSKSRGNVINPDQIVAEYGADTLRLYEMFMGPFEDDKVWNTESIKGVHNFLKKFYQLQFVVKETESSAENLKLIHQTIKKVSEDLENFRFNTAISTLMIFVNQVDQDNFAIQDWQKIILLLSPLAPHLAEELWQLLGNQESLAYATWPEYDQNLAKVDNLTIGIQVNGKLRETIELPVDTENSKELEERVLALEKIFKSTEGKEIKKFIYVKNKIISIVI